MPNRDALCFRSQFAANCRTIDKEHRRTRGTRDQPSQARRRIPGQPQEHSYSRMALTETRRMVLAAAAACEDKKGEDTRVLQLDPSDSAFTDFFLITSAANERQAQAIADEIELRLKRDFATYPNSVEGRRVGEWILLDYVDFVVHIFLGHRRAFYDIERLRKSARVIALAELTAALTEKTLAARKKVPTKRVAKKAPAKKAVAKRATTPKKAVARKSASAKSANKTAKTPAKRAK